MNTVMEYVRRVTEICELHREGEKPLFLVAGPVNAGKSTLVNSLLEKRVCPDDAAPSSLFPVHLGFSNKFSAVKQAKGRSARLEEKDLRSVLKNKRISTAPDKVEIFLPSGLLGWCNLVDTPGVGLSVETDRMVREYMSRADGIIFLFHQRGIDQATHRFLSEIGTAGIKGWISFWINANLGLIDGTSLTETKQAIRSLFPGKSDVFALNTADRSSTGLISLFLKVRAFDFFVREIESKLSRADRTIPGLIDRASLQAENERFLIRLWEVVEKAGAINSARQALRELPLIYGNMVNLLGASSSKLITGSVIVPPHKNYGRAGRRPGEVIRSLLEEISLNGSLARHDRRGILKKAAAIQSEKFRVMVVGPFSTGKTTFLNALLGETLLPAEDRATTSCPVLLRHGHEKAAEVEHLYHAEFFPTICQDGKYSLDYREVKSLTGILENNSLRERIAWAEVCTNGLSRRVTTSQLAVALDELCAMYSKAEQITAPGKIRRIPFFSKKIPARTLTSPPIASVKINLTKRDPLLYHLDDSLQRVNFYRAISPPRSLLAGRVVIRHPSENLSFAEFTDTPGLDSLHKRHYERAASVLASGSLVLFFLHAKHVLNGSIPEQISLIREMGLDIPALYVINFADTLSDLEKEKVLIHIRQKLGQGTNGLIPYPRVYAISALNALQRGDDGFERLLRQLRKKAEDTEAGKTARTAAELRGWLSGIASGTEGRSGIPHKTRQEALYYLGELERLTRKLLGSGVI
ncbi:MAG: hypothetical protein JL50_18490 [Peptococcaceae bacterium BICA1-7]|nr:MAG: hypothetical protein JL50_18490 [Peptococcaceae bacterium BICA1-7]HBV99077.1 hypothetical protein [Desulfotomaculum sp.]